MPEAARRGGSPLGTAAPPARATTHFLYSARPASCSRTYNKGPARRSRWGSLEARRRNRCLRRRRPISTPRAPDACDSAASMIDKACRRRGRLVLLELVGARMTRERGGEPFMMRRARAQARTTPASARGAGAAQHRSRCARHLGAASLHPQLLQELATSVRALQLRMRRFRERSSMGGGCGCGPSCGLRTYGTAAQSWRGSSAASAASVCDAPLRRPQRHSAAHAAAMSQLLRFDFYV
ncbi:hypothetical protein FA09DRAFT_72254 [Tilletiopsis washingtonensis]|jgi:hypothetical protein|uniref:Uncharacterized protein n=1 Tax=Tilletiopsis washingtonensis TaxID=58919 RepID=A0A316Z6K6_9BASI|nr:hypothetical protein FA09DRAFT_72254 [Tilletiopsis washingtonensis]PWN96916.1 hypothetical protein FA09DRAFT_72254 [Tilletiopsis washingtonensis]